MPPVDGLILTPGLASFFVPSHAGVYFTMFDVGIGIASEGTLNGKLKLAYKVYSRLIDLLTSSEHALGGKALVVIPDDWDLSKHVKLSDAWLASQERGVIHAKLAKHGYEVFDVLVVRRFIKDRLMLSVDLTPFKQFIKVYGNSIVYAIPANVSNALVDFNIKCRHHPSECITHINLGVNALVSELNNPWIHLLGPPPRLILSRFINNTVVTSADTTGHRLDIVHYNYMHGSGKMNDPLMLMRLKHYLK